MGWGPDRHKKVGDTKLKIWLHSVRKIKHVYNNEHLEGIELVF